MTDTTDLILTGVSFEIPGELPEGKHLARGPARKDLKRARFSDEDLARVVNASYMVWTSTGRLGSAREIGGLAGMTTGKRLTKILQSEEYRAGCRSKGIPESEFGGLTARQMYVLQIITNPTDKRDLKAKLEGAGVPYTEYRGWCKQKAFADYLNRVSEGMLLDHQADFHNVVVKKALSGDLNAVRYANELNGRHDPNKQKVVELQGVVTQLLEIIMRNVKDPEVLKRISNEFALTMNSQLGTPNSTIRGELE